MKVWISKLTAVLCSALVLTLSADIAFAGPKKTPRLKVTKLPRVALPQAKPPSVAPAPVVTSAVERAVTAKVAVPSYGPKGRAPARTSEQVWEEVTQFMREHGRIPSPHASDDYERKLRYAWDWIYQTKQTSNGPFVVRLIKLHKETVKEISAPKTPQEVLEGTLRFMQEHNGKMPSADSTDPVEKSLRLAGNKIWLKHKNDTPEELAQLDEYTRKIVELFRENVRKNKTPQEVLEGTLRFMQEHNGKMPLAYSTDPMEKSLRQAGNAIYYPHKNDTPEELAQLDEYTRKIVELFKENVKEYFTPKTPQEVLEGTLLFRQEHNGELPSRYSADPVEKSLSQAGNYIWRQHKNDTPEELAQLDEYTRQIVELFGKNVRSSTKKNQE